MIFSVSGYWKDDGTEFDGLIVNEFDDTPKGWEEEEIFFFGLSEADLKNSSLDDSLDFIIMSYTIISNDDE